MELELKEIRLKMVIECLTIYGKTLFNQPSKYCIRELKEMRQKSDIHAHSKAHSLSLGHIPLYILDGTRACRSVWIAVPTRSVFTRSPKKDYPLRNPPYFLNYNSLVLISYYDFLKG